MLVIHQDKTLAAQWQSRHGVEEPVALSLVNLLPEPGDHLAVVLQRGGHFEEGLVRWRLCLGEKPNHLSLFLL